MKKILFIAGSLLLGSLWACDDDNDLAQVIPEATGTITDNDGNEYGWVRYNGLDWMTSNFREGVAYYDQTRINEENGREEALIVEERREDAIAAYSVYGNLYTYEDAVQRAPEGWRLPSDKDWQNLEQALGMSLAESESEGWRGSGEGVLIQQDETGSGIHLQCGGWMNLYAGNVNDFTLLHVREFGYYWSSDADSTSSSPTVYYRRIRPHDPKIEREPITIQAADHEGYLFDIMLSVRYVRDAK